MGMNEKGKRKKGEKKNSGPVSLGVTVHLKSERVSVVFRIVSPL
jgi:hypothetical protein